MHVLISGAGIAGPSLAWWLSKLKVGKVTIVEKAPSLLALGQNVDVHGTSVQILKQMGLLEDVKRLNTTEKGTQFVDGKGGVVASFPVSEPGGKKLSATSEFEILRGDLSKILVESSQDLPNVEYRFNTTIEEILSNDEEDSVKVRFSTGQVESFGVLVAADGQWSRVRKMAFPQDSVEVKDFDLIASYWTAPRTSEDNDLWNLFIGLGRRTVGVRPDPHGTIRVMMSVMPQNESDKQKWNNAARQDKDAQKALLKREFRDVGWEADRLLESLDGTDDFYFQVVQQIRMKKWSAGRVVCLGDTAHAPTPLTGMGTSLAIIGSYVLAQELKKLEAGQHPSLAFDEYERVFKPFVVETQKVPSIFPGIVHPKGPVQRWFTWKAASAFSFIFKFISSTGWLESLAPKSEEEFDFLLPSYDGEESVKVDSIENKKSV